jgi:hypothetical membrane protein
MGLAFLFVTLFVAAILPGYSLVRNTVSEIGGLSSPLRWPFSGFLACEAALLALFASALFEIAKETGRSRWPAVLLWIEAGCYLGLAAFPTPHPLHNLFGLGQVVGYSAMLAAWLSWRRDTRLNRLAALSAILFSLFIILFLGWMAVLIASIHNPPMLKVLVATQGLSQRTYIYALPAWVIATGWVFTSLLGDVPIVAAAD